MIKLVKRKGFPEYGENVVVTVKNITPYAAFCSLNEYPGKEGMIHISEVTGKWVKDIKKSIKLNKQYVTKVLRVDEKKGHINLSLKRLSKKDRERKYQDYKREERAEKLLEILAKKQGMTLDQAYEKIGYDLQDKFGYMFRAFDVAIESDQVLVNKGISKKIAKLVHEVAKENIQQKQREIKATLNLRFYSEDGIERIKNVLNELTDKYKLNVKYISAPLYGIEVKTQDPRATTKRLKEQLTEIISRIKDGEGSFVIKGEK